MLSLSSGEQNRRSLGLGRTGGDRSPGRTASPPKASTCSRLVRFRISKSFSVTQLIFKNLQHLMRSTLSQPARFRSLEWVRSDRSPAKPSF